MKRIILASLLGAEAAKLPCSGNITEVEKWTVVKCKIWNRTSGYVRLSDKYLNEGWRWTSRIRLNTKIRSNFRAKYFWFQVLIYVFEYLSLVPSQSWLEMIFLNKSAKSKRKAFALWLLYKLQESFKMNHLATRALALINFEPIIIARKSKRNNRTV